MRRIRRVFLLSTLCLILIQTSCAGKKENSNSLNTEKETVDNLEEIAKAEKGASDPFDYVGSVWTSKEPEMTLEVETSVDAYVTLNYQGEKKKFRLLETTGNDGIKIYALEDYMFYWCNLFVVSMSEQNMTWYNFNYIEKPGVDGEEPQYKNYEKVEFIRQK